VRRALVRQEVGMARQMFKGHTGRDVRELQCALNFHVRGPATPLKPDGIFGSLTDTRVREFQKKAKIKEDGIVGPITASKLFRSVGRNVIVHVRLVDPPLKTQSAFGRSSSSTSPLGGRSGLLAGPSTAQSSLFGSPPTGTAALVGKLPSFGQVKQTIPDFVPPSQRRKQSTTVTPQGFEDAARFLFNPLADDDEHPFQLKLDLKLPWPIFLPEPLTLEIDPTASRVGKFQLGGTLKLPLPPLTVGPVEFNPYFSAGAGVNQTHFKELNLGANANIKMKLLNLGGRARVVLEADGGVKFNYDAKKDEGEVKGVFTMGVGLEF
jgi:peptidoglycan hydrolase-like protein with peptidoglycan-binding domain